MPLFLKMDAARGTEQIAGRSRTILEKGKTRPKMLPKSPRLWTDRRKNP